MNSQPSILGQQPYSTGGPGSQVHTGPQYAPAQDRHAMTPPAGWNPPAAPQSMPMQMHNYPYGGPPPQMGPGQVPPHVQNGLPPSNHMHQYHHHHRQ